MGENPQGRSNAGANKAFSEGQVTQEVPSNPSKIAFLGLSSVVAGNAEFGEGGARAETRVSTSETGAVGVRFETRGARTPQPQQANTSATASQPGSREVDCRPCGGCCGSRRGRRLPVRVYDFVAWVAGVLGVPMCRVVNEYPELFCVGGSGSSRVGVSERGLSRRVQYKAGYFLKMVGEAGELNQVIDRLILAAREYLGYVGRRVVGVEEARQYVEGLARELGFNGTRDFALYLWWLIPSRVIRGMEGLVTLDFVERRGPYVDVLSVRCQLPHEDGDDWQVHTTMDLPKFLRALVTHFRHVHGFGDWRVVAKWVIDKPWRDAAVNQLGSEEGEVGREDWRQLSTSLKLYLFEDVLGKLIDVLVGVGLVEDLGNGNYKCVFDGVVVRGRFGLFKHLRSEHRDLANDVRGLLESMVRAEVVANEGAE